MGYKIGYKVIREAGPPSPTLSKTDKTTVALCICNCSSSYLLYLQTLVSLTTFENISDNFYIVISTIRSDCIYRIKTFATICCIFTTVVTDTLNRTDQMDLFHNLNHCNK